MDPSLTPSPSAISQSCRTPATAQRHFLKPLFSLAPWWETMCPTRRKTRQGVEEVRGEQTFQQPVPVAGGSREQRGGALIPTHSPSRPLFPCCDKGFSWGPGGFLPSPPCLDSWRKLALGSQLSTPTTTGCLPAGGLAGGPARSQRGHPTPPCHRQNMFSCFLRGRGGCTHPE